MSQRKQP